MDTKKRKPERVKEARRIIFTVVTLTIAIPVQMWVHYWAYTVGVRYDFAIASSTVCGMILIIVIAVVLNTWKVD